MNFRYRRSMGLSNKATVVYLVEDHTDPEPRSYTSYWAHVYLSRERARAGVELFAERGGHGAVRWKEHSPVSYAYSATDNRQLYRVVPLTVRQDNDPEP